MSMESDVKSATITSTGVVVNRRGRIRGIYLHSAGGTGTFTLADDAVGTVTTYTIPQQTSIYLLMPGRGILCNNNINCTAFTNITSATIIYEG